MTFEQRRNRLTTHFAERVPVVKRRISVPTSRSHLEDVFIFSPNHCIHYGSGLNCLDEESLQHFKNKHVPQRKKPNRTLNPNNQALVFLNAICLNSNISKQVILFLCPSSLSDKVHTLLVVGGLAYLPPTAEETTASCWPKKQPRQTIVPPTYGRQYVEGSFASCLGVNSFHPQRMHK